MTTSRMSCFLHQLTRGMAAQTLADLADRELIQRLLAGPDEAAFEGLVRRHGPMVYRVCWRVLQHAEDCEDAFQATFLLLARKLPTVKKWDSLASWLHGVAHRVALNAKKQAAKRRRHEGHVPVSYPDPPAEIPWREVRAVLDTELASLPEKLRLPLILCYLEGRSQEEAAAQLGWSKSTLLRRLEEARMALRRRLTRKGIVWPAALSGVLLSDCMAPAALSSKFIGATVEAAASALVGRAAPGVVSANVTALAEGVVKAMFVSKIKLVVLAGVLVGALVSGAMVPFAGGLTERQAATEKSKPSEPAMPAAAGDRVLSEVLKQALQTAEKVEDPAQKVLCLGWVAKALHLAGEEAPSRAALQQAVKAADAMPLEDVQDAVAKFNTLHFLSGTQAEVGDFQAAKKTAAKIQKPPILGVGEKQPAYTRAWALADIAIRQAKAGKLKDALETAAIAGEWKGRALIGIAAAQAKAKNWKADGEIAQGIQDDRKRAEALLAVAQVQAKAGNRDDARTNLKAALQATEKIPPEKEAYSGPPLPRSTSPKVSTEKGGYSIIKVLILSRIAQCQADMGDTTEALQTVGTIAPDANKDAKEVKQVKQIHRYVAVLYANDWKKAWGILEDTKDWKKAVEIAELLPMKWAYEMDGRYLLQLTVQLQAREFRGISSADVHNLAMARTHVQEGGIPAASKLLQKAARDAKKALQGGGDLGKPMLVYSIAFLQAEIGEEKTARAWIAKESSPYVRIWALMGLLDGLAKRTGKQRVCQWE